jgi:hypothetical protein
MGAPPIVALFFSVPLTMLMGIFCSSPVGNALFAAAAVAVCALLKKIGQLEERVREKKS